MNHNPFKYGPGSVVTLRTEPPERPIRYTVTAQVTRRGKDGEQYLYALASVCPHTGRRTEFDAFACEVMSIAEKEVKS